MIIHKLVKKAVILSVALTSLAGSLMQVTTVGQAASVQSKAKKIAKRYHFKGQILLTSNYGRGVKMVYVGDANKKKHKKNNSKTIYPLASLQKAVTGAMIEQLIAKHKLSMNTKLSKYYPHVSYSSSITVRELLNHTSGIYMNETAPSKVLSEKQAYRYTLNHLRSTGSHSYNYTNANYTLLAGMITKITHHSYYYNVQHRIVRPLKLKHTYDKYKKPSKLVAAVSYKVGSNYRARSYQRRLFSSLVGAGNLYTDAKDYYKIQRGMRNGKILTHNQYRQLRDNYQVRYAGGMYRYSNGTKSNHGADNGYDSYMMATEGNSKAIVYFANQRETISADIFAQKLFSLIH